jgi:S1-C subfamily serine protease
MGDSITKVNNFKITNPEDLLRAIMLSDEKVLITVAN